MTAPPLCPSLVAVIVAVPTANVVTRPALFTVATAVLALVHVTARPVSTLFDASRVTAVACVVLPAVTDGDASDTLTVATGTDATVITAPPLCPSLVAVIVAVPTASDVTRPLAFTVATAVFELLHVIARPLSTLVAASRVTAVACVVLPAVTDGAANVTLTEATGTAVTVMSAPPL